MAIEYDLDIATQSSATEAATCLAEIGRKLGVFDTSIKDEQLVDKELFVYTRLGACVNVVQQRQPHARDPIVT
ncbi:hypothetical protein AB5L52_18695 [Streptomyces sp. CG4]|uniref:hypothetical protein n=1 Tax=Streptomyces sp. CG4 TaxID=408783 RepID=UPI0034E2E543